MRTNFARLLISALKIRLSSNSIQCLELGSGPLSRYGWITLDACKGADVYWDLKFRLPFKNDRFEKVYCSHLLEHFTYRELKPLLNDVFRILKPGGQFLICVPDASKFVQAYLGKFDPKILMQYEPAISSTLPMDILSYIFYMDGHHKFMFDFNNLQYHLSQAGFSECVERSFDSNLDSASRNNESLYMHCIKP
jgi:predicted SAM-dependent methyltransferase